MILPCDWMLASWHTGLKIQKLQCSYSTVLRTARCEIYRYNFVSFYHTCSRIIVLYKLPLELIVQLK
jgi:hypothetical protein